MDNYAELITAERAFELGDTRSLKELQNLAKAKTWRCEVCGAEAWKYAGQGLCFSCTTGESDASEDYELKPSDRAPIPKHWLHVYRKIREGTYEGQEGATVRSIIEELGRTRRDLALHEARLKTAGAAHETDKAEAFKVKKKKNAN